MRTNTTTLLRSHLLLVASMLVPLGCAEHPMDAFPEDDAAHEVDDRAACVWHGAFDLEEDFGQWGEYLEPGLGGALPVPDMEAVAVPSLEDLAVACGIDGGAPHGNVHCYRNLPSVPKARAFVLRTHFWYDPPSSFANEDEPSVVQALEFTASKWLAETRWELALQWRNVGDGAPGWFFWDPSAPGDPWQPLGIPDTLGAEHWHSLELWGSITPGGQTRYDRFSIDGETHALGLVVPSVATPGVPDKLAVAVQADSNELADPYRLVIDGVDLEWCTSQHCGNPSSWYLDGDGDGYGRPTDAHAACWPPAGRVANARDCDDGDPLVQPGVGVVLGFDPPVGAHDLDGEPVGNPDDWAVFHDGEGSSLLVAGTGGAEPGIELQYSLAANDPGAPVHNWVVARWEREAGLGDIDLGDADFLLVPFVGTGGGDPRTLEIKIQDDRGCMTPVLLEDVTDLPQWRTAVVSLHQLTRPDVCKPGAQTDPQHIRAIEIGISETGPSHPQPSASAAAGTVTVGPIRWATADELRVPMSSFECVPSRGEVMGRIARRLVEEQEPHGFIRSWFPESPGSYNVYTQAMALLVLTLEHQRTGQEAYRQAAIDIATRLVEVQGTLEHDGAWPDLLVPDPGPDPVVAATGPWVGSHAWVVIALRTFIDTVPLVNASAYEDAVTLGIAWILDQQMTEAAPGAVTTGTEGNVSSYFALMLNGEAVAAQDIFDHLMADHWDPAGWFSMVHDDWTPTIDVMCNWGARMLRSEGLDAEALDACGLAAGIFAVRSFDDTVAGLGDIAGPWQPTVEFSGQYAATGGIGAETVMEQMLALEDPSMSGAFPGAPDDFFGGAGWNTSMTGIAPSAWVYLALHGSDPLASP